MISNSGGHVAVYSFESDRVSLLTFRRRIPGQIEKLMVRIRPKNIIDIEFIGPAKKRDVFLLAFIAEMGVSRQPCLEILRSHRNHDFLLTVARVRVRHVLVRLRTIQADITNDLANEIEWALTAADEN